MLPEFLQQAQPVLRDTAQRELQGRLSNTRPQLDNKQALPSAVGHHLLYIKEELRGPRLPAQVQV